MSTRPFAPSAFIIVCVTYSSIKETKTGDESLTTAYPLKRGRLPAVLQFNAFSAHVPSIDFFNDSVVFKHISILRERQESSTLFPRGRGSASKRNGENCFCVHQRPYTTPQKIRFKKGQFKYR